MSADMITQHVASSVNQGKSAEDLCSMLVAIVIRSEILRTRISGTRVCSYEKIYYPQIEQGKELQSLQRGSMDSFQQFGTNFVP